MPMRSLKGFSSLAMLSVLIPVGLCGCDKSKATKANFDQIQVGTTFADAKKLLGDPTGLGESRVIGEHRGGRPQTAQTYRWKSGNVQIDLEFADGKVIKKSATGL